MAETKQFVDEEDLKILWKQLLQFHGGGGALSLTLKADNWVQEGDRWSYDLGETYSNRYVTVGIDGEKLTTGDVDKINDDIADCMIFGSSGTKLYAIGKKPTVDIPVVLRWL